MHVIYKCGVQNGGEISPKYMLYTFYFTCKVLLTQSELNI